MLKRLKRRNDGPSRASIELHEWTQRYSASLPVGDNAPGPVASEHRAHVPWRAGTWGRVRDHLTRVYARVQFSFSEFFAWHGNWISHHQRRMVLLCNLVIASLFYPAVVIYLLTTSDDPDSSMNAPVCVLRDRIHPGMEPPCVTGAWTPTNIWDMAKASLQDLTGSVRAHALSDDYPVHDLRLLWDETPTLAVVSNEQREMPAVVHVAQVLLSSDAIRHGGGAPYGVLHPQFLLMALQLQNELDKRLTSDSQTPGPSCIRRNETNECLVLSPLEFWHRDEQVLLADPHPAKSYTGSPVRAVVTPPVAPAVMQSPLPLLYSTTLSGRWPFLPLFSRAEYLVLTYFLHETNMHAWPDVVRDVVDHVVPAHVLMPQNITAGSTTLQFKPESLRARPTLDYKVVIAGYLLLLTFIFRGLVQMRRLHSRFGIAFTGSAQLVMDLIMSRSLCALLGIHLTAVPWPILPFVVVVVGSETMLFMIRVVTNTPLSLTVNSRVAYGLSQVAGPITLSTATDVLLLLLLSSLLRIEAVTQFVLFTICALVVDYFMQMTFFITVLSIDIQRLELAEVLLQGTRAPSTAVTPHPDLPHEPVLYGPRAGAAHFFSLLYHLWRIRTARGISVAITILAACAALVAYGPKLVSSNAVQHVLHERTFSQMPLDAELDKSPYGAFWRAINPTGESFVRMVLEPWTLVTTTGPNWYAASVAGDVPGPWLEHLFFDRRSTTVFLFFLFVIAPIALSMVILSMILNYLLLHSEKLEASAHHDSENIELRRLLEAHLVPSPSDTMSIHMSVHADELHPAPILVTAATKELVVSADTHHTLRIDYRSRTSLHVLPIVRAKHRLMADSSQITALATEAGRIAIGQVSGRVSLWDLDGQTFTDVSVTLSNASADSIDANGICDTLHSVQKLVFCAESILSLHGDGSMYAWPSMLGDSMSRARVLVESQNELAPLWTAASLSTNEPGTWIGASSSRGHLAIYHVSKDLRVVQMYTVQNPANVPIRCAVLVPQCSNGQNRQDLSIRPAPPRNPGILSPSATSATPRTAPAPTTTSSSSSSCLASPAHRYNLVAGDEKGILHVWKLLDKGSSSIDMDLALDMPFDGPVRAMQIMPGTTLLLVQTSNRVWLIEWLDTRRLPLQPLDSIPNPRGSIDIVPMPRVEWLLGICRAGEASSRWEIWRARIPSSLVQHVTPSTTATVTALASTSNPAFKSASSPKSTTVSALAASSSASGNFFQVERIPIDIESLIRTAVLNSVVQGLHPPSRLPLLTTRIDRMFRVGNTWQWIIPFGSTILAFSAEQGTT